MSHEEGGGSKPSESKDPAAARITSSAPPDRKTCSLFASWDYQTFDAPAWRGLCAAAGTSPAGSEPTSHGGTYKPGVWKPGQASKS